MLGDGTIGSWWRKVWPLGARRDRPPANDAMFIDVMADFSRQLSERVARQSATNAHPPTAQPCYDAFGCIMKGGGWFPAE